MFTIHALPARFGDSLLLTYGNPHAPNRVLIDGGTAGTRQDIRAALGANAFLELLVVTHIDIDHIDGVLRWLEEATQPAAIGDIWFNGWDHLPHDEAAVEGALQGERLSQQISAHNLPWNNAFGNRAVVLTAAAAPLPRVILGGGLQITLLSPTPAALAELRPAWDKEVRAAGLIPGVPPAPPPAALEPDFERHPTLELPDIDALSQLPFKGDTSVANASSIAFIAEYQGTRALFAADAHADTLHDALQRYAREQHETRVRLDLCKLSHHGSRGTTSRELLQLLDCNTWLISTNGARYRHPDAETIARILTAGGVAPTLIFNYRSPSNAIWDDQRLKQKRLYTTLYPKKDVEGIQIHL